MDKADWIVNFLYKMYLSIFILVVIILLFFTAIVVSRAYDKGFNDGTEMMIRQQQEEGATDYEIEMRGGDASPVPYDYYEIETETL
jgi:ABC-type protease/lipase transport system fused ATPase/permease subunit